MVPGPGTSRVGPFGAFVIVVTLVVGALVACHVKPAALDVTTVAPCVAEDGPALDGPVPCVWDGETRGNGVYVYGVRWILYSAGTCPVLTIQDRVHCVSRDDWSGSGQ